MTSIDKYYYFLIQAMSSPNKCAAYKYYYDSTNHALIRIGSMSKPKVGFIELEKLEFEEKRKFIIDFASKQQPAVKKILMDEIDLYDEYSEFNFQNVLYDNKIDASLLDMKFGNFCINQAQRIYKSYNLDEKMIVIL